MVATVNAFRPENNKKLEYVLPYKKVYLLSFTYNHFNSDVG